ncbi:glycosyltransferase family 9 protein [Chlorobium ferrooxidans]|nr:glycosyltransferase family 9 protein [Chlorobium ferrooxidans]
MSVIKKILVIRLSSIGDIILTTPLLRRLNEAFPDAVIDYCTKAAFSTLLSSNPRISSHYTPEQPPFGAYDLIVDLQNNSRSRSLVRHLHAAKVVRYRKQNWKKWLLVQFKVNLYGKERHVVERYQDSLERFALPVDRKGCELYPSAEERGFAESFFITDQKTLALCFGAKHYTKRYPPERFAELLGLLLKEESLQVLLLGGEEDAPQASGIMHSLPDHYRKKVVNLSGNCSLMQTAAILERCDAVLCNDTGLMHMASAFGKKLFVLFGSSSSAFGFLPYHAPFDLFEVSGLRCRPCSHIGRERCPRGHFRCMNELSARDIASRILDYFRQAEL